jgi:hypothetical protein
MKAISAIVVLVLCVYGVQGAVAAKSVTSSFQTSVDRLHAVEESLK